MVTYETETVSEMISRVYGDFQSRMAQRDFDRHASKRTIVAGELKAGHKVLVDGTQYTYLETVVNDLNNSFNVRLEDSEGRTFQHDIRSFELMSVSLEGWG